MNTEYIYKKIFKDISLIALSSSATSLSGILLLPFFTKSLGAHDYGLYIEFIVTISLTLNFATLGLPYATVRFLSGKSDRMLIQEDIYSTLTLISISSTMASFLFLISSNHLSAMLFDNSLVVVYILVAVIPIECLSQSLINIFRVFQETKKYAITMLTKIYLELIILIISLVFSHSIQVALTSLLFFRFFFLIILFFYIKKLIGFKVPAFRRMKEYLTFSLPTIPTNLSNWIIESSGRYLIGANLGLAHVGYYNSGYMLGSTLNLFMIPINFVLVSILAKYYEDNDLEMIDNLLDVCTKYFLILAVPSLCGLSILSFPILNLLSNYEIANEGRLVTPIIGASCLLFSLGNGFLGLSLYLTKKTRTSMYIWIIIAIINLLLNIALIPAWGILGSAIATFTSYSIGFALNWYFSIKLLNFSINIYSTFKIIISALIMSILVIFLNPRSVWAIAETIIAAFFIYILALILLGVISTKEIAFLRSVAFERRSND